MDLDEYPGMLADHTTILDVLLNAVRSMILVAVCGNNQISNEHVIVSNNTVLILNIDSYKPTKSIFDTYIVNFSLF